MYAPAPAPLGADASGGGSGGPRTLSGGGAEQPEPKGSCHAGEPPTAAGELRAWMGTSSIHEDVHQRLLHSSLLGSTASQRSSHIIGPLSTLR